MSVSVIFLLMALAQADYETLYFDSAWSGMSATEKPSPAFNVERDVSGCADGIDPLCWQDAPFIRVHAFSSDRTKKCDLAEFTKAAIEATAYSRNGLPATGMIELRRQLEHCAWMADELDGTP